MKYPTKYPANLITIGYGKKYTHTGALNLINVRIRFSVEKKIYSRELHIRGGTFSCMLFFINLVSLKFHSFQMNVNHGFGALRIK